MITYSTSEAARILGIEKTRVRDWIVKGFIIPSWHKAMARGDKNLLTYDDLCSIYLFQQLLPKGFNRIQVAFIISKIAKKGLTFNLNSELRYVTWNTKFPKEGGAVEISNKIPDPYCPNPSKWWLFDLLEVKTAVDQKGASEVDKRRRFGGADTLLKSRYRRSANDFVWDRRQDET